MRRQFFLVLSLLVSSCGPKTDSTPDDLVKADSLLEKNWKSDCLPEKDFFVIFQQRFSIYKKDDALRGANSEMIQQFKDSACTQLQSAQTLHYDIQVDIEYNRFVRVLRTNTIAFATKALVDEANSGNYYGYTSEDPWTLSRAKDIAGRARIVVVWENEPSVGDRTFHIFEAQESTLKLSAPSESAPRKVPDYSDSVVYHSKTVTP